MRSLVTVSELREELQLGFPWKKEKKKLTAGLQGGDSGCKSKSENMKDASRGGGGGVGAESEYLFSEDEFSHQEVEVSVSPGVKKAGQIDSFVYKNYSLHNRRTLSLPVGREYSILEYVGYSSENIRLKAQQRQSSTPAASVCFLHSTQKQLEDSFLTVGKDDGAAARCTDFDITVVDRGSKWALFWHVGCALLTIVGAILAVCVCVRFLTFRSRLFEYEQQHKLLHASLLGLEEESPVSFFSCCKMLVTVCPFLGTFSALFVTMSGASGTSSWCWWSRSLEVDSCMHHEEAEDSRMRIEQANEKVQRAYRAKQQFMAYVFHNIRVPFNAIVLGLGHMQAAGDRADPIGNMADKVDLVQMMLDCAETMTSVLDDVTDMGQLEVGQIELHSDEFDILAVIKCLSFGLKELLEQKDIAFSMNVDEIVSKLLTLHHVLGDKQWVVQTLGNFLSNAVKFTPAGGKLELKVQCEEVLESKDHPFQHETSSSSVEPFGGTEGYLLGATGSSILTRTSSQAKHIVDKVARLRISVEDNGIGISAEDQAKLFEPYSFVTSGWVQKGGFSGLGLSMAKRYVERVGGNIGVESLIGKGSTFFFTIPFPLVPWNANNETEILPSNSEACQMSEASQLTRTYDLTLVQKYILRRWKSMEEDMRLVQKGSGIDHADNR